MDAYQAVRSLPFPVICQALGLDVANYKLHKQGTEYQGRCPVHNPKQNNNSFCYNISGTFHCFACPAKGKGGIDLVMAVRQCNFTSAVELLTRLATSPPPPDTKKEPVEAPIASGGVLQPLVKDTWKKFAQPCKWLEDRIPDARIRELYGVYMYNNPARKSAYSGRVMIPVKDVQGQLMGYLGRALPPSSGECQPPDVAKYLFPKGLEKSKFLFGAAELKSSQPHLPVKYVYLVESPFCVMKFASLGLPAVSPFGWSVSAEQIEILASLTKGVVALPDRNKYQESSALAQSIAQRLWLRFPPLPDGCQDPEQLSLEQIQALTK